MKLKKIILLAIIIAAVYFFYWNLDFNAANQKLKTLDAKYLNGIMPIEEKSSEYKTALGLLKNEFAVKGPSTEKNALFALIGMRLKTVELIDYQKAVDAQYKLNGFGVDCTSKEFSDLLFAYDNLNSEINAIITMVSNFEKSYSQYKNNEYVKDLKDSMSNILKGIENQKEAIKQYC